MILDVLALVPRHDDEFADAGGPGGIDGPVDEALPTDLEKRFDRRAAGEPAAASGGDDDARQAGAVRRPLSGLDDEGQPARRGRRPAA